MPASLFSCTDTRQNNLITRLCFICYTVHNFCCFLPAWYSQNTCRHDTTGEDSNKSKSLSCCVKSCVNLDFVRVTNTLFIRQLLWLMYGLLWHEAEINKTTSTSDGKTGTNFLAPGKWCSPKLSWACAETSIRRDVMLTVMWVKQTSILRSTHK